MFYKMKYAYKTVFWQVLDFSYVGKNNATLKSLSKCVSNSVMENQVFGFSCSFLQLFCSIFLFSSMFSVLCKEPFSSGGKSYTALLDMSAD